MTSVGPFSIQVVAVVLAGLVAWVVARFAFPRALAEERKRTTSLVLDAITVGLLAARLAYVVRWWQEYMAAPLSIVTIADGGFDWWIGIPAALLLVWWRARDARPVLHKAVVAMGSGLLVWCAAQGAMFLNRQAAAPLPSIALVTPDARTVMLDSYVGKPTVVNLWASWCPPCRREMPVLARADAEYADVNFLLINQGEDARIALGYLARERFTFRHLLLDPTSRTMQSVESRGLPTTLFFDANGRLVESHMGELSAARLKDTLQKRFQIQPTSTAAPAPHP